MKALSIKNPWAMLIALGGIGKKNAPQICGALKFL